MAITTGSTDLEFVDVDGVTVIPVMFAQPRDENGMPIEGRPKSIQEALVSSDADAPLSEWLEPSVQEDWSGGFGESENGYGAAIAVDTFSSPGYAVPAGACTEITVQVTSNSPSPIVAFFEFGGDLWIVQQGTGTNQTARVMHMDGGTSAPTNALRLGANEYMRDLLVADDGAGGKVLWASSSSVTGASGRLHKMVDATAPTVWASTNGPNEVGTDEFGTNGRNRMVSILWTDEDQISAPRIVVSSSNQGHISYLKPYADPSIGASGTTSWVEDVRTLATTRVSLVAARRHVWMRDARNVYDINEHGDSIPLLAESTNGFGTDYDAICYLDDYVYFSHEAGIGRVYVGGSGPTVQSDSGTCSPGYRTRTRSIYANGYCTSLLTYRGGILAAMYPPGAAVPVVFWGKPKRSYDPDTENPLRWHGPLIVGTEAAVITRMYAMTLSSAPTQTRLLLASWHTNQSSNPRLAWVSMPSTAGAIAGLAAGGGHRFATGSGSPLYNAICRLETLPVTMGDKSSTLYIHEQSFGTENLDDASDPTLVAYTRADATPASSAWGSGTTVNDSPTQTVTPATTSGNKIEQRVDFFSPNGGSTPPVPAILDSMRTTYFRTAPSFDSWTFDVEFGAGVVDLYGTDWANLGLSTDWFQDRLTALCRGGRTTMRDRQNNLWTVKLKQAQFRDVTLHDGAYGKTIVCRLTVAILGAA